ncbi:PRELI-like family-domain-containing protein [Zychaea mexicana]|uniref:PRELI-like family-domain-containing protein n=1 Tax=Zychaea mexicana TaxID=64656 RepID=UPI0022FDD883|nr:PRELI-like family-domain-containing protein [Zychaea mexicana]KAI9488908.1 PRELI-like family-domain-containing protein [Zychaea mexicana]
MKLFKSVHDYQYEWSLVSAANWQKYPNEHCTHVQAVDVLDRRVDPKTGILTTERLITVNQNVPALIMKLLGCDNGAQYVREISIIDPKKKTMTMRSQNLTMSNLLSVEEEIVYCEHPEDHTKTQFTQQAAISAGSLMSRWASVLEDFSVKRFQQNAAVGREGFSKVSSTS